MRKRKSDSRQPAFDFTRRTQILREAIFPAVVIEDHGGNRKVCRRDVYDVVRVIADHGQRCWPSLTTIAFEARMNRAAVVRAIKALQTLDILCVDKQKHRHGGFASNTYTIAWERVDALPKRHGGSTVEPPSFHSGTTVVPQHGREASIERQSKKPPPPTPNEETPSKKEVEEAFKKSGIDGARSLRAALQKDGVTMAEAMRRLEIHAPAVAKLAATGKIKRPAGALYHAVLADSMPVETVEEQPPAEPGYPEWDAMFWPEISAMSLEEQAGLLGDETARSNLRRFGPADAQNRYALVMAYHYGRTACRPQLTSNC